MGGLAKGLAIIESLSNRGVQSSADAARASGATRAAARRCLLTLVDLGYVERVGREFRPLPRLRSLGRGSNLVERLAEESAPFLAKARDRLGESISLAVRDGDSVTFIARAEANNIISTGVRVGAKLPAYCSATGRVLLSQLVDRDLRAAIGKKTLPQLTPKTLTKPSEIFQEISGVRNKGYAESDEELELGMRSLAVPVRDASDTVVAAMSVSAYSARVSRSVLIKQFVPVLQEYAAELEVRCFGQRTAKN
ncbi:MAG: helix-turn-helix domain-containing protein [Afipia sp.]|nr:helix-turn-helix domain-containing protein [Afipia sp.]